LIAGEEFEDSPPFNCEKINSTDYVRGVPTVVRGWCMVTELTSASPIPQALRKRMRKRVSSAISGLLAA
jgi:hypothetical protein